MPLERRAALLQASADLRLFLLCDEVYHLLSFEEEPAFQALYPDGIPPPFACLASTDAAAKTSGGGSGGGGENKCNDDNGDASVTNRGDGDGNGDVDADADADTGADTDDADADDDVLFGALAGPDLVLGLAAFTKVGLVAHVYLRVSLM